MIVATRAFGLGINKENIRFVIRNVLAASITAWAQELERARRDGKSSEAHIFEGFATPKKVYEISKS